MLFLRPNNIFDITTGETFKENDLTGPYEATINPGGYGGPNVSVNAINAVRFIWGSYVKQQLAQSNVTEIVAGTEYTVGGTGSFTYDTKTYNAGDTIISMLSGTPTLSNCTLSETGRFSSTTIFLPIDVITSDFSPSLLGIDALIFPDSTYSVQMDIWTTLYAAGAGRPAGTYIVITDTITISGVTYRPNEVFTQGGSFTFTGSGSIVLYNDTTKDSNGNDSPHYFLLSYYAFQAIKNLELDIASSCCVCRKQKLELLYNLKNKYAAILLSFQNDLTLDFSGTQVLLEEIVSLAEQSVNC